MPEKPSPTAVFYGSATPEQMSPPKPERSKTVEKVQKAIDAWLDRVGPGGVEKHFIKAHENILKTFSNEDRAKAYEKTGLKWKKWGKALGITATVFDSGLVGLGIGITQDWFGNASIGIRTTQILGDRTDRRDSIIADEPLNPSLLRKLYLKLSENIFVNGTPHEILELTEPLSDPRVINHFKYSRNVGSIVSAIPGLATLFPLTGIGPAHTLMHIIAGGAEQFGKMRAKSK